VNMRHLTEEEAQLHLEDLLPHGDHARVEEHLALCGDCRALVLSFEALEAALAQLPAAEPPPDFTAGVFARIDERKRTAARDRRVAVGVLGAAAAALAVTVALAGQSAWAPALSQASAALAEGVQAARISRQVLSPIVGALRLQILVACAALGLPLILGLVRLVPVRARQVA